jgi:hypothetical protein
MIAQQGHGLFTQTLIRLDAQRVSGPLVRLGDYTRGMIAAERGYGPDEGLYKLATYVLSRRLVGDEQYLEVKHPATWWQHAKLALPGWPGDLVRDRWPVRWATARAKVSFTKYDTYPGADITPKELGVPVQVDVYEFTGLGHEATAIEMVPVIGTTPVSPGREFVSQRELTYELGNLAENALIAKEPGYRPLPGHVVRASGRNITREVLEQLEAMGVNASALVQRYRLDDAIHNAEGFPC